MGRLENVAAYVFAYVVLAVVWYGFAAFILQLFDACAPSPRWLTWLLLILPVAFGYPLAAWADVRPAASAFLIVSWLAIPFSAFVLAYFFWTLLFCLFCERSPLC